MHLKMRVGHFFRNVKKWEGQREFNLAQFLIQIKQDIKIIKIEYFLFLIKNTHTPPILLYPTSFELLYHILFDKIRTIDSTRFEPWRHGKGAGEVKFE